MSLLSGALIMFAWPPSLQVSDFHRHTNVMPIMLYDVGSDI